VIALSYLIAGFVAPLFYAIPVWTYATGEAVLVGSLTEFVLWRLLYFLTMSLALRWLFRGHQPGKQFQMLVGLFPVYAQNAVRALFYRKGKPDYHVNNAYARRRTTPSWLVLLPQITLLLANMIGPFVAMAIGSASLEVIAANACVSALAIWSLLHVCLAAFERKTWHPATLPARFYATNVEH
jgi:cellulose synthase (UDP-forming)